MFNILSLSGGGFLGLYTVSILAELEKNLGRPIASCFDLMAGTSIGGIIALGLAAERPAIDIKSAFEKNGSKIFSDRPASTGKIRELLEFCSSIQKSKYENQELRKTIIEIVGEQTIIGDLKHPVMVPTVNLTKGKPQIFKTPHHSTFVRDHYLKIVDVALATSAAPTYFPISEIGDELFADGGLYANSPDILALHEAEHFFEVPKKDIQMLSIGTTTTNFSFSHVGRLNLGVFGWGRRLAQTMISAQQMDATYILGHQLGDRYMRIDEILSNDQERDIGLDIATKNAQKTIRGVASGSIQGNVNDPRLIKILSHRAPQPRFFNI